LCHLKKNIVKLNPSIEVLAILVQYAAKFDLNVRKIRKENLHKKFFGFRFLKETEMGYKW
jgi:hypothetical protein